MIRARIFFGISITAIAITVATPVWAGLWDTIREQADKARSAIESLDRTVESSERTTQTKSEESQKSGVTGTSQGTVQAVPSVSTRPSAVSPHYDNAQVRIIQTQLDELGYSVGTADGYYGPGTRKGIEAFQRDHGLPVDGKPSAALQASLEGEVQSAHQASTGPIVTSAATPMSPASEKGSTVSAEMFASAKEADALSAYPQFNSLIASPVIRPLNLQFIKGKPVIEYGVNGITGDGKRLLELLVIGANPDLLTPPKDWLNAVTPYNTCARGQETFPCLLSSLVNDQFTKEVREKYVNSSQNSVTWRSRDEFEFRKDLQYVAANLLPVLGATAANFKFPVEIAIENNEILPRYDFQKQLYPASYQVLWGNPPFYEFPVISEYQKLFLPSFEAPHAIKLSPDIAQKLHERAGRGYVKVVYVIELQGLEKIGIRGQVKSIDLYSQNDKSFTTPLYSYDAASFNKTEAVVENGWSLGWEKSLNWQKTPAGIPDERYFLAAYASMYGEGEKTIDTVVEAYANDSIRDPNAFEQESKKNAFIEDFEKDEKSGLRKMLQTFDPKVSIYLAGEMQLGKYNFDTKTFPVKSIDVHTLYANRRLTDPAFTKKYPFYNQTLPLVAEMPVTLSIPPAVGETLYKNSIYTSDDSLLLPVRVKVQPIKLKVAEYSPKQKYYSLNGRYGIQEIEILSIGDDIKAARNRYLALDDKLQAYQPSWVLWRYSAAEQQAHAAEFKAAADKEQLTAEAARAAAAKAEKEKYSGKFNVLGATIGMDLKDAEGALDPYFRDKQVVRYTTSPAQVVDLMQKFGIKPPTPATSESDLINQSSEATNADSLAYTCKLSEETRRQMRNKMGSLGNIQADWHATVKWHDRDLNCQEMEIVAKLLILDQSLAKDALHTATGFGVGAGEFIALYKNTKNQVVAMLRQIRFPKDTSPSRQALMKDLVAKYGEPATQPRGSSGFQQAIWLLPTTKSTRPIECGAAVKQSAELWFKDDGNGSAMSGVGLSMTVPDLKSATQMAGSSCSEAVVVTFDDSNDGLRLNQIVLADHQDLDAALPALVKSAGMAISSVTKAKDEPAANVQF